MAIAMMSWLIAIPLLGVATGLRSMTPLAVLCWFAHLGILPVEGSWAAWTAKLWVAVLFTVLAVGELIGDKLPKTPNRTSPVPLIGRLALGGLAGAICASALEGSGIEGVMLGVIGAAIGTFGGYMVRRDLTEKFQCADWVIAVGEDLCAILFSIYALHVITA